MSKIKNNPILKGASGMLGNVIVYREVRGKMIMANRPKKSDKLTDHQEKVRSKFLRGVQYAKKQVQIPANKAEYATGINNSKISAYAVAITDYLTPPKVNEVDTSRYHGVVGDKITINATDDFKVVSVQVVIVGNAGAIIEQGDAVMQPDSSDMWDYTAKSANAVLPGTKITVSARDKAGNLTSLDTTLV